MMHEFSRPLPIQKMAWAALLGLAFSAGACAQAGSLKNPIPLGPGVNSGLADSNANTHYYYYFWAGPGHVAVSMGFKSMGVLGNPLREAMSFDFFNEQGQNISHDVVVSLDKMERANTDGDFDVKRKVTIQVTTPPGVLRTGGRFEIEVKGAVAFDADRNVQAPGGPTPGEEALIKPGGPLVQSGGPLVQPGGALVQPVGPLVQPGGALVHATGPLVRNSGALVQPVLVRETPHEIRIALAGDVLFDFDKATLRADALPVLQQAADIIRKYSRSGVRIEGNTDSRGDPAYNVRLSLTRAQAVASWLAAAGFPSSQLRIAGLGATHPVAPNVRGDGSDDAQGRQRNRRVDLVIAK